MRFSCAFLGSLTTQKSKVNNGKFEKTMKKKIFYFDVLRVVAAIAVVAIHVIGPYRYLTGEIPEFDWIFAIGMNGASRWAVPIFIMITGALLLADQRKLSWGYFIKRRVFKVLIPFLAWSIFYAALSGISLQNVNYYEMTDTLRQFFQKETYYHLGFFYYFIPLYFLIPLLRPIAQMRDQRPFLCLLSLWFLLITFKLMGMRYGLAEDVLLYGGYLLLGYQLYRSEVPFWGMLTAGVGALLATEYTAISASLEKESYTSLGWFSYTTINTALIAAMVFVLCQCISVTLSDASQANIEKISRHTLGIYLVHPIFLWPVRAFELQIGMAWITIPVLILVVFWMSYQFSVALAKCRYTAWLVP